MSGQGKLISLARRLFGETRAATAIEFAVLAPALITMMLGVLQAGFYLQSQNALRGMTADLSRHLAVEYQKNNYLNNEQLQEIAYATAVAAPYMFDPSRLDIGVADASTQRISGAREVTLTMSYDVPNILGIAKTKVLTLDYKRAIFVPAVPTSDDSGDGTSGDGTVAGG